MSFCYACMNKLENGSVCNKCGFDNEKYRVSDANILPPGTVIRDRYVLGVPLGQGGFGITYIGYDQVLNARVAIKEYFPSGIVGRSSQQSTVTVYANDDYQKGKERFLLEARTLAKFADHPCIVGVKDCFEENDTAYMVMEYLDGISLKEYLKRKDGKVPVNEAIAILTPVMDALKAVHKEGIIHRDVSPDNIFISNDSRVRLIDFGAARQSFGGEKSLSIMLKPGYAPEEQYRTRGNQGPWTDVYALTATFYRMIVGKVPPDSLERVLNDTLDVPLDFPTYIRDAIQSGMAIRATERLSSISQLQDALNNKLAIKSVDYSNSEKVDKTQNPKNKVNKNTVLLIISAVAICLCVCITVVIVNLLDKADVGDVVMVPSSETTSNNVEESNSEVIDSLAGKEASLPTPQPVVDEYSLVVEAVDRCINDFVYAINTGDVSVVSGYIDVNSGIYNEEIQYIRKTHNQGITEEAISYNIDSYEWVGTNQCKVIQSTSIRCYYTNGSSKVVNEAHSYLLEKIDGKYLYVKQYY